jgi:hypothetical protein
VSCGDGPAFATAVGVPAEFGVFGVFGVSVVAAAGELVFVFVLVLVLVFVLALESVREPAVVCAVVPPEPPPSWTTPVDPLAAFPPPVPVPAGPPADVPSTVTSGVAWTPDDWTAPLEPVAVFPPPTCTAPFEPEALFPEGLFPEPAPIEAGDETWTV